MENPPVSTPATKPTGQVTAAKSWMSELPSLTPEPPKEAPETPASASEGVEPPSDTPPAIKTPPEPVKAQEAPPVKASDAPPAKPAEVEEEKWPRNASDWDKFKSKKTQQLKERDEKLAAAQAKIAELEKRPAQQENPEFEMTKKERDELSEKLRLVAIEKHPKFQQYYANKISAQVDLAKRIVGSEKGSELSKLLDLPDSDYRSLRIDELLAELTPMQQSRIGSVMNSLDEINAERSAEIGRATTDYAAMMEKTKSDTQAAQKKAQEANQKEFDAALQKATDPASGIFTFQKRTGDEEWNKGVEQRLEMAKNLIFGKNDPQTLIQAALYATSLPSVLKSHQQLHEENTTLKAQIESMKAATPKVTSNGGSPSTATTQPQRPSGSRRPSEIAGDWMKDLQEARRRATSGE